VKRTPQNADPNEKNAWPTPEPSKKKQKETEREVLEDFGEWLVDEEHDSRHSGQRHPFVQTHLRRLSELKED